MQTESSYVLRVPPECQRELVRLQDRRLLLGAATMIGLPFAFHFVNGRSWISGVVGSAFFYIVLLVRICLWPKERKKQWRYEFSPVGIDVFWLQVGGRAWDWHTIRWRRDPIIGIEHTEWRGLPALRLLREIKNPKWRPDWLIVYGPEDAERVQTQILPLLETYRRQYRQIGMTDRLRQ